MISRRHFLTFLAAASAAWHLKTDAVFASQKTERNLNISNIHTGESLDITYFSSGLYDYEALEKINYILRCHYTNEVKAIDPAVLDLLSDIKDTVGRNRQLNIISGYRSPAYNSYLIDAGRRVAKDSLHQRGLAIDFAIEGISNHTLFGIAKSFGSGGVGKYQEFVHIDIGRVRYW
jgi:uncharacterized protein YcbK (DUF882 family)